MCSFKMNGISITPFMKRFDWYCGVHTTSIILEAFSLHWFLPIHTLFKKKRREIERERNKRHPCQSILLEILTVDCYCEYITFVIYICIA